MINYSLLYGNWDISSCLLYFISTQLKHHIFFSENMGVVAARSHPKYGRFFAPRPPFLQFLEITTDLK